MNTGRFGITGPFHFCTRFLKIYRAQKKLYNKSGIVLPVRKCVSQNGKTIPKVFYSLFWALKFFLKTGTKMKKVHFF